MVPLHDVGAAASVDSIRRRWEHLAPLGEGRLASAYLYCRGGIIIQPAFMPGCSAPAWASLKTRQPARPRPLFQAPSTSSTAWSMPPPMLIEQGVEMGRPSFIHLHLDIAEGKIASARIGGHAIKVAEGELTV